MRNENKFFIIIVITLILIAVFTSIITKESFIDTSFKSIIESGEDIDFIFSEPSNLNKDIKLDDLIEMADVIVKVSIENSKDRDIMQYSTIGSYRVEKTYKGDIKPNSTIRVYEKSYINCFFDKMQENSNPQFSVIIEGGHNFMKESNEYILFLNKTQSPIVADRYETYMMVDDFYGLYNINNDINIMFIKEDDYKYNELLEYDIFINNREVIKKYENIRNEIISTY